MARQNVNPADYGVQMEKDEFTDQMVEDFADYTRGTLSFDEMLLRPRTALHFCDQVRQKHGYFDLPDDIILRVVMQRRKNPLVAEAVAADRVAFADAVQQLLRARAGG